MSRKLLITGCLLVLLTGCAGSQVTPFLPPTAIIEQSAAANSGLAPAIQETQAQPTSPTATPACTNQLTYLLDLTLPDGSQVPAGSSLDKRWKVQNSGTCNWDARYRVKLVSGTEMGTKEQSLYPARGGAELTIQILFTAPSEPGSYHSTWQAYDPEGNPFGDLFYMQVEVTNP